MTILVAGMYRYVYMDNWERETLRHIYTYLCNSPSNMVIFVYIYIYMVYRETVALPWHLYIFMHFSLEYGHVCIFIYMLYRETVRYPSMIRCGDPQPVPTCIYI